MGEDQKDGRDLSSIQLAYASLAMFADDGTLDIDELNMLLDVALRDGVITDGEKEVLRGVFNRILEPDVTADVWQRMQEARQLHGI
ncbi:MAG: hypothetical protein COA73_15460 [Candidatus Hydrogenedentota bacterium]|nr:MAG: hypothetical protein COA73_15460 [Candidatus Hydrogenedentota bacterium]